MLSIPRGSSATPLPGELSILSGLPRTTPRSEFLITVADSPRELAAYRALRHREFVERQALFEHTDLDDTDEDPRTAVLVATLPDGTIAGGVRVAPTPWAGSAHADIGWWFGSRLVVAEAGHTAGLGAALVRAACAHVEQLGALRFDATVQDRYAPMFVRLGWRDHGPGPQIEGRSHREMRYPVDRVQRTVDGTKAVLAEALAPFAEMPGGLGSAGFRGDDGVPLPGTDVIAACDAIVPSMIERDPEWAGWCSVLVNIDDLSAMGARPLGLLDAVGAPTTSHLTRIIRGISSAAAAWRTPVLGGHTQVGVPSALSVTALGTTDRPLRAGGGAVGDTVTLHADLGGSWRPGYHDRQWDSTSSRSSDELCAMASHLANVRPASAKDVSMAGIVGTLGMLAEASGTGAELDVTAVPRPDDASMGGWLTCFPGYAMLSTNRAGARSAVPAPDPVTTADCGRLTTEPGVRLRWPDGETTVAVASTVTGLGSA
ncbi:Selenophosphate synthetase-like protein [Gordonia terrae C-6]|uniref:Selenophosphate synthetase-like protein n=1 Tax=Gordonia terrae C-6 TaxID=1316928 RepID=R7YA67_9ACTN|nr:MSMEG_0567/sll0787 family protein [Gordonia terrae]EON32893.1 Selenophosphate synthetase-like protein [Gordonia terrae C-6]